MQFTEECGHKKNIPSLGISNCQLNTEYAILKLSFCDAASDFRAKLNNPVSMSICSQFNCFPSLSFLYNHYIYEMIYWTITIITTPQPVSWVWDQYGCTGLMLDLMF